MNCIKGPFILLFLLVASSCGVPRAEHDRMRVAFQKEKNALVLRNSKLEQELNLIKAKLAEMETQYSSLFFKYESLSRDYLKLKRSLTSPELGL